MSSVNSSAQSRLTRDTHDTRPSTGSLAFRSTKHTVRNDAYGERILSESHILYLTHDRQNEGRTSPPSHFYYPYYPPLDEYLKLSLKNTKKELKTKYDQMKSSNNSSDFLFKQQNEQLLTKRRELKQLLHNFYLNNNPTPDAKKKFESYKPPFSSSGKRDFQKTSRLDRDRKNIPHFFKSEQDWNFGIGSRQTSMSFEQLPNLMHDSIISVNNRVASPSTNSLGSLESRNSNRLQSSLRGLGGGQLGQGLRLSPILMSRKH